MIVFDLRCQNGHFFEGWFDDGQTFEDQMKNELIVCPVCEDKRVMKVPSSFAIKSSPSNKEDEKRSQPDLRELEKRLTEFVENNFENVGANFTREALKIHYGVSEARNIRGFSTPEEEKTLKEEGIEILKFPLPVKNDSDS
jgi:hypothetical protein